MKVSGTTNSIRQLHPGRFRRPDDGIEPFAYVNGQKLDSKEEQKKSAVYANNEHIQTLENGLGSDSTKLFDSDAGLKIQSEKRSGTNKEEEIDQQYDNTGNPKNNKTQEERTVDRWV